MRAPMTTPLHYPCPTQYKEHFASNSGAYGGAPRQLCIGFKGTTGVPACCLLRAGPPSLSNNEQQ
eukprot:6677566-Pyramimonas_sp.AAC.1